jgi:hypothetical protein
MASEERVVAWVGKRERFREAGGKRELSLLTRPGKRWRKKSEQFGEFKRDSKQKE